MVKVIMDFIPFGNRKERATLDVGKYFSVHWKLKQWQCIINPLTLPWFNDVWNNAKIIAAFKKLLLKNLSKK